MEPESTADKNTNRVILLVLVVMAVVWWELTKSIAVFLGTLGILIAIHEWGHFIAAKAVGVHVYEFALGMGKKLVTYMRRGGTEYTIRVLPIGGFVNPKGMQPDDPITPDGLNGRRPAERALVYLAGPLMNVILGSFILLFSGCLVGTADESRVLVGEVTRKKPAEKMQVVSRNGRPASGMKPGLQVGDRVLSVNGEPITRREDVTNQINPRAGKPIAMQIERGRDTLVLAGTPLRDKVEDSFPTVVSVPPGTGLALRPGDQVDFIDGRFPEPKDGEDPAQALARTFRENAGKHVTVDLWRNSDRHLRIEGTAGPVEIAGKPGVRFVGRLGFAPIPGQGPRISLAESLSQGKDRLIGFAIGIAGLFSKPKAVPQSVGGPIEMFAILSQIYKLPAIYYFNILASLSLSLAVFNLLPVPTLDGGHMLLLTLEVLRRRRLEPEVQRTVAVVGLAIIGVLFVLILGKDIWKHIL